MLEVNIQSMKYRTSDGDVLEVLRDLYFDCPTDSFTTIVGPSGCGKTTTLRCILELESNYTGSIQPDLSGQKGKISAVFQEPRLLPWRTVDQNVRLVLKDVGEQHLDLLYSELGLAEHKDFYPTELSLGLARRVGLARAFAVEPSVLILDEPFVSLDEETASRLRKLLLKVWSARSCTALLVTHNLEEAIELSDRILFFSKPPSKVVHEFQLTSSREARNRKVIEQVRQEIIASGAPVAIND